MDVMQEASENKVVTDDGAQHLNMQNMSWICGSHSLVK